MDVADQLARAGATGGGVVGGIGGRDGREGGLVVEAVQVAAGLLELGDPTVRLGTTGQRGCVAGEEKRIKLGSARRTTHCTGAGVVPAQRPREQPSLTTYLHDHHMAVKGALAGRVDVLGALDERADLGDDGGAKGHVGDEVAVHDVDVQPVRALLHLEGALLAQGREVGAEDGGGDDGVRSHAGGESVLWEAVDMDQGGEGIRRLTGSCSDRQNRTERGRGQKKKARPRPARAEKKGWRPADRR